MYVPLVLFLKIPKSNRQFASGVVGEKKISCSSKAWQINFLDVLGIRFDWMCVAK